MGMDAWIVELMRRDRFSSNYSIRVRCGEVWHQSRVVV